MLSQQEILAQIKSGVQEVIPGAKVYLFGSRARGDWHEESDWDILVLTKEKVDWELEHSIYEKIAPVGYQFGELINCVVVNENEWNEHPRFYILFTSIKNDMIAL